MLSKPLRYHWHGIDRLGQSQQGRIIAKNKTDAHQQLRKQGMIARRIVRQSPLVFFIPDKRIKAHAICILSRQIATTLAAGLSVTQAIELITRSQKQIALQQLLTAIQQDLKAGFMLAEALRQHPRTFNSLFCNLTSIGEESGTLDQVFANIAAYLEKTERMKQRIRKTMTYPIAMATMAILVLLGLLLFVIPQFESLFKNFGAKLPGLTVAVINLSNWLKIHGCLLMCCLASLSASFRYAYQHGNGFKKSVQQCLLSLPLIGPIIQHTIIFNMASTLAMTTSAGIPLADGIKSLSLITNYRLYVDGMAEIHRIVTGGEAFHKAIQDSGLFPAFVVQMVGLGEECSTMEDMLRQIAHYYENLVDHAMHQFSMLLEPIFMTLLGVLIGGLIMVMYIPILKLGTVV